MNILDSREQAFEQRFAHDEETRFKLRAHRNHLFGCWAAEQLGYGRDVADHYVQRLVAALCEPFDGIMSSDDKVVSRVVLDLTNAGLTMSPDDIRGVLTEFEDKAKLEIEGKSSRIIV